MKIVKIEPYVDLQNPTDFVDVYDITVANTHLYSLAAGIVVSNSKRVSLLDVNALLSHGATETLRDAGVMRGQKNEDLWMQFMSGNTPGKPRVPMVYEKFVNQLKSAGINVVRDGYQTRVMALTRKDVDTLAGDREILTGDTVRFDKALKPVKGGLFDEQLTGGHSGKKWSYIKLPEPLPNPVMEEPIRRILGLTGKQYEAVLSGEHEVAGFGTGPEAIAKALDNLNLDKEINIAKAQYKSGKASARDAAVRKWGYLKSARDLNLHPREWVLDKVPVLPPAFRPVSVMGEKGIPLIADANYMYKELLDAKKNYTDLEKHVGVEGLGNERLAMYHAFKAVTGLGDPVHPKLVEKGVTGVLKSIFGTSPKYGTVQRKLISSTVDSVGRGVISPNPDYDMDTVGLPEDKAFDVYRKSLVRRLKRNGMSIRDALHHIKERTPLARETLLEEMEKRPVFINRAPVLHKFGIMAFRPKLVQGTVLQISPLVVGGFNADFDGNCLDFNTELLLTIGSDLLRYPEVTSLKLWENTVMRLTGSTLVDLIQNGQVLPIKIGEFPRTGKPKRTDKGQEIYEVPPGVSIVSYDHAKGAPIVTSVTRLTVDRDHTCVRVKTTRDRKVIVSDNESMCVFDVKTGGIVKAVPALGQLVPYVKKDPLVGNGYNFSLGWWYGALAADGWVSPRMVGYAKNAKEKRERFVEIAKAEISDAFAAHDYFETDSKSKFGNSAKVHLNGQFFARKVFSVTDASYDPDSGERGALYKKLPQELLYGGSRYCLLGLLSGLLDGDCTLGWNKATANRRFVVRFNTSSKFLVKDIKTLLRKLGVRYSVTEMPARNNSKKAYAVSPSISDMYRILPECKLVGKDGKALVAEFLADKDTFKDDIDIVPISSPLATALQRELLSMDKTLYAICSKAKKTNTLSRSSAEKIIALLSDMVHPQWAGFVAVTKGTDIHWEIVNSVEEVKPRDVFDLEIPETKVFSLANGLVIFDTMQFHVPSTDEAVKEAYDRLLPSRSLLSPSDFKSPVHKPGQQYMAGLYHATRTHEKDKKKRERVFRSKEDAIAAYKRGEISADTDVSILE